MTLTLLKTKLRFFFLRLLTVDWRVQWFENATKNGEVCLPCWASLPLSLNKLALVGTIRQIASVQVQTGEVFLFFFFFTKYFTLTIYNKHIIKCTAARYCTSFFFFFNHLEGGSCLCNAFRMTEITRSASQTREGYLKSALTDFPDTSQNHWGLPSEAYTEPKTKRQLKSVQRFSFKHQSPKSVRFLPLFWFRFSTFKSPFLNNLITLLQHSRYL